MHAPDRVDLPKTSSYTLECARIQQSIAHASSHFPIKGSAIRMQKQEQKRIYRFLNGTHISKEETWVRRASKHAKWRRPLIDKESDGLVKDITP